MYRTILAAISAAFLILMSLLQVASPSSAAAAETTVTVHYDPIEVQATVTIHVRWYTVQHGDTLSRISGREYGRDSYWPDIYNANRNLIQDPNSILVGWRLRIPALGHGHPAPQPQSIHGHTRLAGTLSPGKLGALWQSVGGSYATVAVAECIAMHESGGNQFATGSVGEEGYWQINPVNNGSVVNGVTIEASYDPYTNARDAVAMSSNGTNWSAWTTAPMCGV